MKSSLIFLIELIEIKQDTIFLPEVVLAIGMAPPEDSKLSDIELEDDSFIHEEEYIDDEDKDDDDFGLNDYEDGYDDQLGNYNDYD